MYEDRGVLCMPSSSRWVSAHSCGRIAAAIGHKAVEHFLETLWKPIWACSCADGLESQQSKCPTRPQLAPKEPFAKFQEHCKSTEKSTSWKVTPAQILTLGSACRAALLIASWSRSRRWQRALSSLAPGARLLNDKRPAHDTIVIRKWQRQRGKLARHLQLGKGQT